MRSFDFEFGTLKKRREFDKKGATGTVVAMTP